MNTNITQQQNESCSDQPTREAATFTPRFDVWETSDELVLSGDVPGVKADDLDIEFENDQLVVQGRVPERNGERRRLHEEYGVGDFYRSFAIGETVDATGITASVSGGVLTIRLPKSERLKTRRIKVQEA